MLYSNLFKIKDNIYLDAYICKFYFQKYTLETLTDDTSGRDQRTRDLVGQKGDFVSLVQRERGERREQRGERERKKERKFKKVYRLLKTGLHFKIQNLYVRL